MNPPTKCKTSLGLLTGVVGGISCKDLAKCNTAAAAAKAKAKAKAKGKAAAQPHARSVYEQEQTPGQSAQCMHGIVALARSEHYPDFMLLENSDELENATHKEVFCAHHIIALTLTVHLDVGLIAVAIAAKSLGMDILPCAFSR